MGLKGHVSLVFCGCLFLANTVSAEDPPTPEDYISHQPPYRATDDRPDPDKYHFPQGSDMDAYERSRDSVKILEDQQHGYGFKVGEDIADRFAPDGAETYWESDEEKYKKHNWTKGECGYRSIQTTEKTYTKDALKALGLWSAGNPQNFMKFYECFEPRFVGWCDQCNPPFMFKQPGGAGEDTFNLSYSPEELIDRFGEWLHPQDILQLQIWEALARVLGETFNCGQRVDWNIGYTFEYWWPEEEMSTNNFGVSSFSPVRDTFGGIVGNLAKIPRESLATFLDDAFSPKDLKDFFKHHGVDGAPPELPMVREEGQPPEPYKMIGQTHSAGLLPGDQTLTLEGHVYQTLMSWTTSEHGLRGNGGYPGAIKIPVIDIDIFPPNVELKCVAEPFWWNGFKRGNPDKCVYDLFDAKDQIISGWTEEVEFGPTWRIAEMSKKAEPLLYALSVPFQPADGNAPYRQTLKLGQLYVPYRSCSSYRISAWPDEYKDLDTAVKATPTSPWLLDPAALPFLGGIQEFPGEGTGMEMICYEGGGQLYPIVNNLMGHYAPIPSSNFLVRRAIELLSNPEVNKRGYPSPGEIGGVHIPSRPPRFADLRDQDKIQRIWPTDPGRPVDPFGAPEGEAPRYGPTGCYRMNDVKETNQGRFPKNIEEESGRGEVRYIYWNKRTACICPYRGSTVAWEDTLDGLADDIDPYTKAAYASMESELQIPIFYALPKYKGWGCEAGRFPHGLTTGPSFTPYVADASTQTEEDFKHGRGDYFVDITLGRSLPFPTQPFFAEPLLKKYPFLDMTELNIENVGPSADKIKALLPLIDELYLRPLGIERDQDGILYPVGRGSAQDLCSGGEPVPPPEITGDTDPEEDWSSSSSSGRSSSGGVVPPIVPPPRPGPPPPSSSSGIPDPIVPPPGHQR